MNQKTIFLLFLTSITSVAITKENSTEEQKDQLTEYASIGRVKLKKLKEKIDEQLKSIDPLARFVASGVLFASCLWVLGGETAIKAGDVFKHSSEAISAFTGSCIYLIPFVTLGYILIQSGSELIIASSESDEYNESKPITKRIARTRPR